MTWDTNTTAPAGMTTRMDMGIIMGDMDTARTGMIIITTTDIAMTTTADAAATMSATLIMSTTTPAGMIMDTDTRGAD